MPSTEEARHGVGVCEDCGHDEAWYEIRQTGAADEPPGRFFKCKDCGHKWREYG